MALANMRSLKAAAGVRSAKPTRSVVRVQATHRVDQCKKSEIMVSPSILSADFARLGEEVRKGSTTFLRGCKQSVLLALQRSRCLGVGADVTYNRSRPLTRLVATGCTWTSWTAALCPTSPSALWWSRPCAL